MMAEGLMTMAEHGQSVGVTPFTLMGAMSPVTLAGALAQQNAEALFGVVLTQLVRPGAPVMYGAFTSNVDMRSGAPAFGTPENTKANIASGQLARRYNLPYRTTPGSASNAADAQGAYETMMALWGAVLGHGNLVYHAAGWQEGGLTASFEKFIIDVEMIQHMMEFLRPIEVNEGELALDALGRVPTGGHFFGEPHTLERYSTAFYQPMLSNWQNYEAWQEAGGLDATRARDAAVEEGAGGICRAADGCGGPRGAGGVCGQAQGRDRGGRAVMASGAALTLVPDISRKGGDGGRHRTHVGDCRVTSPRGEVAGSGSTRQLPALNQPFHPIPNPPTH